MKRKPNGYGSIQKLSGNRLKSYAVYTPYVRKDGKKAREIIGYFERYEEADRALAQWNLSRGTKTNYTLKQLYDEWSIKAYKSIAKQTADSYKAAFNKMEQIQHLKVRDIRTGHFQQVVDRYRDEGKSYSSLHDIKVVAGLLEKYAMQYDIIQKNYSAFIELPPNIQKEKEIFSQEQIEKLEEAAEQDFMWSRLIVILMYTGWRISELLNLTPDDYDAENKTLTGGVKTDNGKNRVVPVHPYIQGYIDELLAMNGPRIVCRKKTSGTGDNKTVTLVPVSPAFFRKRYFKPTLDALGIKQPNGEDFTPHATRHVFATMCRKNGLDSLVTKKLIGHSLTGDVTEKVYTHVDLEMLNEAMLMINKNDKPGAP